MFTENNNTESHFTSKPEINVITKEDFENRVESVFNLIWGTLSRSFGPYGAPTIILNYPYSHVTKDGYTIMKNLMMDTSHTLVDQSIFNMASDICGRLNYSVGDGTTTAVIATNGIYQRYRENKKFMNDRFILPRDIAKKYNIIKNDIEQLLRSKARTIKSSDSEELYQNISDVVYISSNGDETITHAIADLYRQLMFPAVTCEIAQDGITKSHIISGFKLNLALNDKLYINSDERVMALDNADILIFGIKITQDIYEKILKPLNQQCRLRGRHLIVAAPYYDEVALGQIIRRELNAEFKNNNDINMVLTTYQATSNSDRTKISDFATLCGTMVIDRALMKSIFSDMEAGKSVGNLLYMDNRKIQNTRCIFDADGQYGVFTYGVDILPDNASMVETIGETSMPIGFVKNMKLGLNTSIFSGFNYDTTKYNILKKEAYDEMVFLEKKYQKLGTFNLEVSKAQQRYYSLNLNMGVIEVGGDSELSQKMMKDTVDDAILAASSAYEHGVVYGCNTSLLQCIDEISKDAKYDDLDRILIRILYDGFRDVYSTVLRNAFTNNTIIDDDTECNGITEKVSLVTEFINTFFNKDMKMDDKVLESVINNITDKYSVVTLHDVLIHYGLAVNKVFDVTQMEYSDTIINSTQTDLEVLTATIDLMGILIAGNQMIVTQRHNF